MYLVACVKQKAPGRHPAWALYSSVWFKKAMAYVQDRGDWRILSAKHGLLYPGDEIEPYDETLVKMVVRQRQAWAKGVLKQLKDTLIPGEEVIFLAGERYREFLVESLMGRGHKVSIPMRGKGIGEQLRWLNENT